MNRRNFLILMMTYAVIRDTPIAYASEISKFRKELLGLTLAEVINAKKYVEPDAQAIFREEGQGIHRGSRSDLKISEDAISLIIACEVTSKNNYNKKLIHPIWPKGESGATIGFGFDVGQVSADDIRAIWKNYISMDTIDELVKCAKQKGMNGKICTKKIRGVSIPWDSAEKQFRYYLPYVVAQTQHAFDNFDLLSEDSRGALVSLVYNRGANVSNKKGREEMFRISELMYEKKFSEIPQQIKHMTRLWPAPDQTGLIKRRNLEAMLFDIGLRK